MKRVAQEYYLCLRSLLESKDLIVLSSMQMTNDDIADVYLMSGFCKQ